jgi:uncharacterized protein (TIGR00645 family)
MPHPRASRFRTSCGGAIDRRLTATHVDPMTQHPDDRSVLRVLANLIFGSRWLQVPLYLGLIIAQCVYVFLFMKELFHLIGHATEFGEQQIMLIVLGLIDVVMISNLLVMVIVGGYETFVSRLKLEGHPDQPEWLSHVNASVLKIKLAMAIIGISSIHLLKTFIEAGNLGAEGARFTEAGVMWQTIIHITFILSAMGIAYVDYLGQVALSRNGKNGDGH